MIDFEKAILLFSAMDKARDALGDTIIGMAKTIGNIQDTDEKERCRLAMATHTNMCEIIDRWIMDNEPSIDDAELISAITVYITSTTIINYANSIKMEEVKS